MFVRWPIPQIEITIALLHTVRAMNGKWRYRLGLFPFPHTVASCLVPPNLRRSASLDNIRCICIQLTFFFFFWNFGFYVALVPTPPAVSLLTEDRSRQCFICLGLFSWLMSVTWHTGLHVTWYQSISWVLVDMEELEIFCSLLRYWR